MSTGQMTWMPWKNSAVRRRSRRSARIPPARMSTHTGASPMNESRPTRNGEPDRSRTSHGSATCCIQVPVFDRRLPTQRSVKLRERSALNTPVLNRDTGGKGVLESDIRRGSYRMLAARRTRTRALW
jgi:hypothetical protein